ncbi:hypothetical protein E0I26_01330 [Flavobacterium rhamnosiphilum]|uniref:Alpha/beta hydrolase n=1 Tax=Flavobacterium rhamnosiphilum TaxID=2541724 RepID=A0A4R5FC84_9FLAO|nr:hypothetical protein [Flavobacterium rhamnosiphilum]TDE46753.1 hypothetical protein E0I26_01330 [Flavobacterium rhamnosiphilum]
MILRDPKTVLILFISFFLVCCKTKSREIKIVKGGNYELKISNDQKAVLILFPCFPCDIENTKTEAKFLKGIEKEGVTTLLLNHNQKLYLTESEKIEYAKKLNDIFGENKIEKKNIYIGGFSSGGNVSVVLSNFLLKTKNTIQPKGVFVVDSPLDLEKLYGNAKEDIKRNRDKDAIEEGLFIVDLLDNEFGELSKNRKKYEEFSPYLISSNSTSNIYYLKDIKTRFYFELDLKDKFKETGRKYKDLNAYHLERANKALQSLGSKKSETIITKNRGYRANGDRNTHSWNIVERQSLLRWINE